MAQLTLLRKELQARENKILGTLQHKGEKISINNVSQNLVRLDRLLLNREKKEIKELYRIFIKKVTFDSLNKADIKLYLAFD